MLGNLQTLHTHFQKKPKNETEGRIRPTGLPNQCRTGLGQVRVWDTCSRMGGTYRPAGRGRDLTLGNSIPSGLTVLGVTRHYHELDFTEELPELGCGFSG